MSGMAADIASKHSIQSSSISSYNITLNLTSLSSFFTYPSRLLARMRKSDEFGNHEAVSSLPSLDPSSWATGTPIERGPDDAPVTLPPPVFPGPWGFFTSGYMVGLFIMAVLMHRIENVVVPTRIPHVDHTHMFHHARRHTWTRRVYEWFLPLNINRTATRLAFHLPTLYFLGRMLLLWSLLLLQTSDLYPKNESGVVCRLGRWSETREMQDISWQTFCAVCAAFCVETFVKGLDGFRVGFGSHMQANTSPFNLVGYAFLLYIYSSPVTHVKRPPDLPSRPDKHVIVTITIPLLQLFIFHLLSVRKRWSTHRFIPTALSSVLSLLHFHSTLIAHKKIFYPFQFPSSPAPTLLATPMVSTDFAPPTAIPEALTTQASAPFAVGAQGLTTSVYSSPTGTANYPILNYIPNVFETLLLFTITLTIFLNALTQLLLTGRVSRPLLGLGLTGSDGSNATGWSWTPPWDEDFGVVLLRVGTASLEATGLRGWGNEVGGIVAPPASPSDCQRTRTRAKTREVEYGSLQLSRTGVVRVYEGRVVTTAPVSSSGRNGMGMKRKVKVLKGWNNEVRDVDLGGNVHDDRERDRRGSNRRRYAPGSASSSARSFGVPGVLTVSAGWWRELRRFFWTGWGVLKVIPGVMWDVLRGRKGWGVDLDGEGAGADSGSSEGERRNGGVGWEGEGGYQSGEDEGEDDMDDGELYDKFLRGQEVSDDEGDDGEWVQGSESDEFGVRSESEDDEDDEEGDEDEDEELPRGRELETVGLYADLGERESTPGATSSTLLAHMAYSGSSPLTRRRFGSLMAGGMPGYEISQNQLSSTRSEAFARDDTDSARRNCVICTIEPRQIICWPCRCLSMCDGCRESLASRSAASKHRCPCCRRTVEGYSRIFIP